jgi:hypothetical protein
MPLNNCDIIIATGSNKGKSCRDINKYCRHQKTKCDACGEEFSHKSSYHRHCKQVHPPQKRKVAVLKKVTPPSTPIMPLHHQHHHHQHYVEMQQELEQLRARVNKVEQEPKNITVVIGDEKIFMGLVKRMGNEKVATQFLLENMDYNDSINIIDKMYLEGIPKNRYPIACSDDYKFRYLNHSGDIVDDKGGIKIVSTLEREIHRALIEANSKLIHECVNNDDNITLYNVYDIGTLQTQLGNYRSAVTTKFRDDLARKVYNTEHPFFH